MATNPWDQQEGEPDSAYTHFTRYLYAGLGRSLRAATKGDKRRRSVGGQVSRLSSRWNWVARARAWDVKQMRTLGHDVVLMFIGSLRKVAQKLAAKVESKNGLAKTDVLELLKFISLYVTPEIIQDVQKLDPAECLCEPQQHKLRPVESVTVTGVGHG